MKCGVKVNRQFGEGMKEQCLFGGSGSLENEDSSRLTKANIRRRAEPKEIVVPDNEKFLIIIPGIALNPPKLPLEVLVQSPVATHAQFLLFLYATSISFLYLSKMPLRFNLVVAVTIFCHNVSVTPNQISPRHFSLHFAVSIPRLPKPLQQSSPYQPTQPFYPLPASASTLLAGCFRRARDPQSRDLGLQYSQLVS